jgi:hypothetical protein
MCPYADPRRAAHEPTPKLVSACNRVNIVLHPLPGVLDKVTGLYNAGLA